MIMRCYDIKVKTSIFPYLLNAENFGKLINSTNLKNSNRKRKENCCPGIMLNFYRAPLTLFGSISPVRRQMTATPRSAAHRLFMLERGWAFIVLFASRSSDAGVTGFRHHPRQSFITYHILRDYSLRMSSFVDVQKGWGWGFVSKSRLQVRPPFAFFGHSLVLFRAFFNLN